MSFYAMAWALKQPMPTPSQKLILIALADAHNEHTGVCIPSHDTLAEQTGLDRSTIIRNIQTMSATGVLEVHERTTDTGRQTSNAYVLTGYSRIPGVSEGSHHATPHKRGRGGTTPPPGVAPRHPNLEEEPGTGSSARNRARPVGRPAKRSVDRLPDDPTGGSDEEPPALGTGEYGRRERPQSRRQPRQVGRTPPLPERRDTSQLSRTAADPQTPQHCAQRFKELLIQDKKIDPVNLKEFAATLKRWYSDGIEVDTIRAMVDLFAARPESYSTGRQDIPWRAFINAREKLQADATKVVQAENPSAKYGSAYSRARSRRS